MNKIINGKKIANNILSKLENEITKKRLNLTLAAILVGNDPASLSFINIKKRTCNKIGIDFKLYRFSKQISNKKLLSEIKKIQKKNISGLIVQLPLPKHIHTQNILNQINPVLDVDCLTSSNLGKLTTGDLSLIPPTPAAIIHILKSKKISLRSKHIVLIGRGKLVGKPLGIILTHELSTITLCNKYTKNIESYTRNADIIISGVGKSKFIKNSWIKQNAIIIDAGTSFRYKHLCGDSDCDDILPKVKYITPVPGGVGPVTVAKLLENLVILNTRK